MAHTAKNGSHGPRFGAGKLYRGSPKRLRQIRWRDHTPLDVWILLAFIALFFLFGIPWLIQHPPHH
jgi:hypothetical protein